MPQARHHEMRIVKLPEGNKYTHLVYCDGCQFQSHVMKEERAEDAVRQHQAAWGYEPKPANEAPKLGLAEPTVDEKGEPLKTVVKPTQPSTTPSATPAAPVKPEVKGGK